MTTYEVVEAGPLRWNIVAVRGQTRVTIAWRGTWAQANAVKLDMEERTALLTSAADPRD